jgi:hypothetical protein
MEPAGSIETFGPMKRFKPRSKSQPTFRSYKYIARCKSALRQFVLWTHCNTCCQPNTVVELLNLIRCIRPRGCTFWLKILIFLSPLRTKYRLCSKVCQNCYLANSFPYRSTSSSMIDWYCCSTLGLLMSHIYIYGAPILDVSRLHTTTQHSR